MYSRENEPFIVRRAVKAVAIPAGVEVNLKVGSVGYITQALGGSFTVYIDGSLFRIAGSDTDSIDKEMAKPPEVPPGASDDDIKSVVWQQLKTCYDPEIPINIVDLGLASLQATDWCAGSGSSYGRRAAARLGSLPRGTRADPRGGSKNTQPSRVPFPGAGPRKWIGSLRFCNSR